MVGLSPFEPVTPHQTHRRAGFAAGPLLFLEPQGKIERILRNGRGQF